MPQLRAAFRPTTHRRPASVRTRGVVIAALVLAAGGLTACEGDKVPIASPEAPRAARERCQDFLDALPDTLAGELRRPVDPDDALGAAWGDPAVVLTCGGRMPADFDRFSSCVDASGVGWYVPESQLDDEGQSADAVLTTVGIRPIVQVRVPASFRPAGPADVMTGLAAVIKQHLRQVRPCV